MGENGGNGNGNGSWKNGIPRSFLIWIIGILVPAVGILLIKEYQRIDQHIIASQTGYDRLSALERMNVQHSREIKMLRRDQIIYQMWNARARKDTAYMEFLGQKLNELDREKD